MIPDTNNNEIKLFYEISELNRQSIIKSCQGVGVPEYEFIKEYSNTTKYAWQQLYYYIFKLCDLEEFQRLSVVFIIGLILILIFVK